MSTRPTLAPDAAIALGIASTAMPFARTADEQVERWLRVLRLHGHVGIALQAIGVSEVPLSGAEHRPCEHHARGARASDREGGATGARPRAERDAVARVTEHATRIAEDRHQQTLTTTDILLAVMHVYGQDFDRVLHEHGTDRDEVLERLHAA